MVDQHQERVEDMSGHARHGGAARCRVVTRVRVEGQDHGGLGLRSRGEGIGHGSEALHKKRMNMTLR